MKSRIFIGSSTESLKIAETVQKLMEPEFECEIWNKNFFDLNQSTYDNLVQKAPSFDYAVFIGGPDDKVICRNTGEQAEKKIAPRDNVYLEFALYAGILSAARSFFLLDEACGIASDLKGITLSYYADQMESIQQCCEELKRCIHEEEKINRIRLLPSTSLAIGYYRNFIEQLLICLRTQTEILTDQERVKLESREVKVNIIIPGSVDEDWKIWEQMYAAENGWRSASIESESRPMAFMIDGSKLEREGKIDIIDIPQTLRVAFQAVDMTMKKDYIGNKELVRKTKQKEVANFISTLKNLMMENPFAQRYVQVRKVRGRMT